MGNRLLVEAIVLIGMAGAGLFRETILLKRSQIECVSKSSIFNTNPHVFGVRVGEKANDSELQGKSCHVCIVESDMTFFLC